MGGGGGGGGAWEKWPKELGTRTQKFQLWGGGVVTD